MAATRKAISATSSQLCYAVLLIQKKIMNIILEHGSIWDSHEES